MTNQKVHLNEVAIHALIVFQRSIELLTASQNLETVIFAVKLVIEHRNAWNRQVKDQMENIELHQHSIETGLVCFQMSL